ncbi:MAG: DMT family transporter, partial [Thermomicrobiales bacterium]|nr:DMT family transporter [Thermomicrobiales bacterium]
NLSAFVASCLLGGAVVATRKVVGDIAPLNLAFLRYMLGGAYLAAVVAMLRPGTLRVARADLPNIVLLGVLMYALFPFLFNTSLRYTTASRGAVILALMPLFTAVLGAFARSEQLQPVQWLGVVCSIAGVAAVFAESGLQFADGRSAMIGNGMMVVVALVGAVYSVAARPILMRYGAPPVTALAMLAGAALLCLPAFFRGVTQEVTDAPASTNALVLYLAIPGGALAFFLASFALSRLSATQASIYINLNPLVATILAALLLGETLTWWFGLGFLLVVIGLLLANLPRMRGAQTASGGTQTVRP